MHRVRAEKLLEEGFGSLVIGDGHHQAEFLYDARTFRQAVVLTVLYRAYTSESRSKDGDWAAKAQAAKAELDDLLGRLTVRWGPFGEGQPATTRTSTRITR